MKTPTHCIGYKLHKDNSRTVIDCYSEKEQEEQYNKIIKEGYTNAKKLTPKQAEEFLDWYKPTVKPQTEEEKWWKWATGH